MPKSTLCQDRDKPGNDALMAEIARGMTIKGKLQNEVHRYAGFSKSSWYERRKKPDSFQLGELRGIFRSLGTSNDVILAIFGRKVEK